MPYSSAMDIRLAVTPSLTGISVNNDQSEEQNRLLMASTRITRNAAWSLGRMHFSSRSAKARSLMTLMTLLGF